MGVLPWVLTFLGDFLLRAEATFVEKITFVLVSFIFMAIEIIALSLSYKHLTDNEVIEAKEEGTAVL